MIKLASVQHPQEICYAIQNLQVAGIKNYLQSVQYAMTLIVLEDFTVTKIVKTIYLKTFLYTKL